MNKLTYVLFHKVGWEHGLHGLMAIKWGGQFCCSFVANLLQYLCAKIIKIQCGWTKLLQKWKGAIFLPYSVDRARLSHRQRVCPSVCLSHSHVGIDWLKTNNRRIVQFSPRVAQGL